MVLRGGSVVMGCCFGAPYLLGQLFSPFPSRHPSFFLYKNYPVTPAVTYPDAEALKSKIIKDNKGKAGIYVELTK